MNTHALYSVTTLLSLGPELLNPDTPDSPLSHAPATWCMVKLVKHDTQSPLSSMPLTCLHLTFPKDHIIHSHHRLTTLSSFISFFSANLFSVQTPDSGQY
jgi:hypothetical protein